MIDTLYYNNINAIKISDQLMRVERYERTLADYCHSWKRLDKRQMEEAIAQFCTVHIMLMMKGEIRILWVR